VVLYKIIIEQGLSNPQELLKSFGLKELKVSDINTTDGLRFTTYDNNIIHLRPSGNAPELRCYVETDTQEDADKLVIKVLLSIENYIRKELLIK
jgi:phosphomannomutase